jgi:hypothetical protein
VVEIEFELFSQDPIRSRQAGVEKNAKQALVAHLRDALGLAILTHQIDSPVEPR